MSKKRRAKIPPFRVLNSENIFRKFVSKIMRSCDKNFAQLQVTNAIIHGYEEKEGMVEIHCVLLDRLLHIEIKDNGKGIPDVEKAKQPFYTTKPECERSGMGFAFMEAFMDSVKVESELHIGTRITMEKEIGKVEDE